LNYLELGLNGIGLVLDVNGSWIGIYNELPRKSARIPARQAATKNELTAKNTKIAMITKFGWITFCFCPLANGNGGFIAHDSDARMSIPGNGTVYVSSQ
jgi:hypothetical protein